MAVEPDSEEAAWLRLREVSSDVPAARTASPELIPSDSNDAWFLDDQVLRVCWRGDRERVLREGALLDWLLTSRIAAVPLTAWWMRGDADVARAIEELAGHLRRLHRWVPPTELAEAIDDISSPVPTDGLRIAGRSMIPLPWSRMEPLVELLRKTPWADVSVLDAVAERARRLVVDLPEVPHVVVHGDASPSNVLVTRDAALASILDWEWVRRGPAALELLPMVVWASRAGLDPSMITAPMRRRYSELFADPSIEERLWFYEIVYNLRGSVVWPATTDEANLPPRHPLRELRRLVARPTLRLS